MPFGVDAMPTIGALRCVPDGRAVERRAAEREHGVVVTADRGAGRRGGTDRGAGDERHEFATHSERDQARRETAGEREM